MPLLKPEKDGRAYYKRTDYENNRKAIAHKCRVCSYIFNLKGKHFCPKCGAFV